MRTLLIVALFLSVFTFGGFSYLSWAATYTRGMSQGEQRFEVRQGEDILTLATRLETAGLIASRYPFLWHLAREGKAKKLVAGTYLLRGDLSIPEIVLILSAGKTVSQDIRVTFPEGWSFTKMAARLSANNLPGDEFLALAKQPKSEWRTRYDFLSTAPTEATLEGFLFPDTYFFAPDASASSIIERMLGNFGTQIEQDVYDAFMRRNTTLYAALTLASIVENEVRSATDRALVSDLFWRRLAAGQPLQSDATIKYILGIDKVQHTFEETRVASPYNTYLYPGLPPGPIGNPGLSSLRAVAFPQANPYFYFLSDPETGETVYAITYEEHLRNKQLYGL